MNGQKAEKIDSELLSSENSNAWSPLLNEFIHYSGNLIEIHRNATFCQNQPEFDAETLTKDVTNSFDGCSIVFFCYVNVS